MVHYIILDYINQIFFLNFYNSLLIPNQELYLYKNYLNLYYNNQLINTYKYHLIVIIISYLIHQKKLINFFYTLYHLFPVPQHQDCFSTFFNKHLKFFCIKDIIANFSYQVSCLYKNFKHSYQNCQVCLDNHIIILITNFIYLYINCIIVIITTITLIIIINIIIKEALELFISVIVQTQRVIFNKLMITLINLKHPGQVILLVFVIVNNILDFLMLIFIHFIKNFYYLSIFHFLLNLQVYYKLLVKHQVYHQFVMISLYRNDISFYFIKTNKNLYYIYIKIYLNAY